MELNQIHLISESAFHPLLSFNTKGKGWDGMGWGRFLLLVGNSVADPDPGSGVWVPGSGAFLTLDPGSGIGFFRIPDPKPVFLIA